MNNYKICVKILYISGWLECMYMYARCTLFPVCYASVDISL